MSIDRYDPNMFGTGLGFCPTGEYVKYEDHLAVINRVVDNFEPIELWYVKGLDGTYFVDKLEAERVCRGTFGDESPDQRYARIFFRRFYREVV